MGQANIKQIELRVQNLDCEHDAAAIERGLADFPGLLALQVYPKSAKVAMSFDPADTSAEALKEKLASLGFPERHWPRLVNATEEEASVEGFGVAPWYYEQVAVVRSKRGDLDGELEILRRFARQQHAPGARPPKLLLRMRKVEVKLRDA